MKKFVLLALVGLSSALAAAAQEEAPRADLSVGYSYFREGFSGGANTNGGTVSGAGYFNNWFGIAGDFGIYDLSQSGVTANTYTFLAGPRLAANRGKSISPFVQVLVGGDRLAAGGGSTHGFAGSAGGGVDLALSRHIAIHPQFDYMALRFANNTHSARASSASCFASVAAESLEVCP